MDIIQWPSLGLGNNVMRMQSNRLPWELYKHAIYSVGRMKTRYFDEANRKQPTDVSHIFEKIRIIIREVQFSENCYMNSVGNLNCRVVTSISGMAPLPQGRQWMPHSTLAHRQVSI
jgi:hypothetical protein